MAVSMSLRRLLRIRHAEEERSQSEVERATRELQRLELAQAALRERGQRARELLAVSAQTGELLDRVAGLHESTTANRVQRTLSAMIRAAEEDADHKRDELLETRVAKRQVETLIDAQAAEARAEDNRRSQSALDDWHRSQRILGKPEKHRPGRPEEGAAASSRLNSDIPLTQ